MLSTNCSGGAWGWDGWSPWPYRHNSSRLPACPAAASLPPSLEKVADICRPLRSVLKLGDGMKKKAYLISVLSLCFLCFFMYLLSNNTCTNNTCWTYWLFLNQLQALTPRHGRRCLRNLEEAWRNPTSQAAWCLSHSPKAWWMSQAKTAASSTVPFRWGASSTSWKWMTNRNNINSFATASQCLNT